MCYTRPEAAQAGQAGDGADGERYPAAQAGRPRPRAGPASRPRHAAARRRRHAYRTHAGAEEAAAVIGAAAVVTRGHALHPLQAELQRARRQGSVAAWAKGALAIGAHAWLQRARTRELLRCSDLVRSPGTLTYTGF